MVGHLYKYLCNGVHGHVFKVSLALYFNLHHCIMDHGGNAVGHVLHMNTSGNNLKWAIPLTIFASDFTSMKNSRYGNQKTWS